MKTTEMKVHPPNKKRPKLNPPLPTTTSTTSSTGVRDVQPTEKKDSPKKQGVTDVHLSQKKSSQKSQETHGIFEGCRVYFNGRTNGLSAYHLNKILVLNGGNFMIFPNKHTTHVICNNLSLTKTNKALKKLHKVSAAKYVSSKWITDSIKANKKLNENPYLVIRPKKGATLDTWVKVKKKQTLKGKS